MTAIDTLKGILEKAKSETPEDGLLVSIPVPVYVAEAIAYAEPVRMKGKWIPKEERAKQEIFICSECGGWAYSPWIGSRKNPKTNWCKYAYCPHCGTEMSKGDE